MRRLLSALLVVMLAGCTAPAGTPVDDPTATSTASPTVSPNQSSPPETPTDATAANTVDATALSPAERDAFRAAREEEARFLGDSPYVEADFFDPRTANVFVNHDYVRENGTYYTVSLRMGELYASYDIRASPTDPPANATTVAYEDLPATVSDEVRWAIENASHDVPMGKWDSLPDGLEGVEYVRYDGETYQIGYIVGDAWVRILTVDPVE